MFTYFFVILEEYYTISEYDICVEEYMDLLLRLICGTKLEDREPMRRTTRSGSPKKIK